jgi:hypothetical protein
MSLTDHVLKATTAISPYLETGNPDEVDRNETALVDLLADLMHWAESKNVDMDLCRRRAYRHFCEEQEQAFPD